MKKLTKKIILGLGLVAVLAIGADCADINIKACASCHGATFEKKALGKSKIVKDMNETAISEALIGYKNGSYGGSMASIMKGQVLKYDDKELEDAAVRIKQ
jgi:cytochrome c-type protein NapB